MTTPAKKHGPALRNLNLIWLWVGCIALSGLLVGAEYMTEAARRWHAMRPPNTDPLTWIRFPFLVLFEFPMAAVGIILVPVVALIITMLVRRDRNKHRLRKSGRNYAVWWNNV